MDMTLIKPIEFTGELDQEKLIEFLDAHEKTQVVSMDLVPSRKNVEHAVNLTEKAYEEGRNISHVPKIGLLLHLTGQRQIKKAIDKAKVRGRKAVFISFNKDQRKTWKEFKNKFDLKEVDLPMANDEEIKRKMERTATFWLDN